MLSREDKKYYSDLENSLNSLLVYRNILNDEIIHKIKKLFRQLARDEVKIEKIRKMYFELYSKLIRQAVELNLKGNLLKEYIIYLVIKDENIFSMEAEKQGRDVNSSLYDVAMHDLGILQGLFDDVFRPLRVLLDIEDKLFFSNFDTLKSSGSMSLIGFDSHSVSNISVGDLTDKFIDYYYQNGCGVIAESIAFRWNEHKGFVGIRNYEKISLEDLIGYTYQKEALEKNTKAFIKGLPANNVLLVGARGTGKSSSVKAIVNDYADKGLRLLEVTKSQLVHMQSILETIGNRGKKFIIFMDDLSFEDFEVEYKYLKSVLEGSIEKKPDNVLIYATSNRRHLIKENWQDRNTDPEEVHGSDTLNEKLSLADRFGITLHYSVPDQREYYQIVEGIAQRQGMDIAPELLKKEAVKWELSQNGRSGRTAKQFIDHLLGEEAHKMKD